MKIDFDTATSDTLKRLEQTKEEFWNITPQGGMLLNTLVKTRQAKSVLEIGTSNGYSGIWILKALKMTGGRLTTIEYFDKRQALAVENFKKCGVFDIVRTLQGMAIRILEGLSPDEKFDVVFIDANKSEYVEYFNLIKPHLTEKALVIADNITSHPDKVQTFIDAVDDDEDFQYEIYDISGGMLVAYKN